MRTRKSRSRAYERRPQADTGSPHALSVAGFKIRPRTVNVTSLLRRAHLQGMVWREDRIDPPSVICAGGPRVAMLPRSPPSRISPAAAGSTEERKTGIQATPLTLASLGGSIPDLGTTTIGEIWSEWKLTSYPRLSLKVPRSDTDMQIAFLAVIKLLIGASVEHPHPLLRLCLPQKQ
jgi:hypothetical protein